jgi:hypothetical protein
MSKSVTFVGPEADLSVQLDVGQFAYVERGDSVDLPDDIADELVERGQFVHASSTADNGAPPKSATKDEWSAFRAAQGHDIEGLTKDELVELPDTPKGS